MPGTVPHTCLYHLFNYQKYHHFKGKVTGAQRKQFAQSNTVSKLQSHDLKTGDISSLPLQ